jgi:hypothetical protein
MVGNSSSHGSYIMLSRTELEVMAVIALATIASTFVWAYHGGARTHKV